MSDGYGRMDEEKEVKDPEKAEERVLQEKQEIDDIIKEDAQSGRKKVDLSFLEDENIYFEDELEEIKSENEDEAMKGKKKGFFKRLSKPKRIVLAIFLSLLALIIAFVGVVAIYVFSKLAKINYAGEKEGQTIAYVEPDYGEILFEAGSEGFRQALKDWATTGNNNLMDNKNVINVLLIGADSRDGTNTGNTDVMMVVSLNKQTKKISLVSFMRDSYLYIEGKNVQSCTKLNAAFSMGGPECLMKTIEHNYKIDIDNYVMVNFESFERIIDAMGGINVDIEQYESDYCSRRFGVALPVGNNVKLNGEQALCFCRIRAIYDTADVKRTENQREVIEAIIDKVMNASLSDLDGYIDILFPEIYTGYTQNEILSLGIEALTYGWAKYPRTQIEAPESDCRQSGDANMWIWVVDYQKAAHDLQIALYGESNITLESDRKTFIELYNEGVPQSSGGGGQSGDEPETQNSQEEPSTEVDLSEPITGEDIPMEDPTEIIPNEPVTGETLPQENPNDPSQGTEGEAEQTEEPVTEPSGDIPVQDPLAGGEAQ